MSDDLRKIDDDFYHDRADAERQYERRWQEAQERLRRAQEAANGAGHRADAAQERLRRAQEAKPRSATLRDRLAARLVAWLWPALEPLIAAVVAQIVAQALDDAQKAQPAQRRYMRGGQ